jgi:hypothetical protein
LYPKMLQPDGNPIAKLIGVDDIFKESELQLPT